MEDISGVSLLRNKQHELSDLEKFREIKLQKFLGSGMVSVAFESVWHGMQVVTKITGNTGKTEYFSYSNREKKIFDILNAPPTIPTIPQLHLFIPSMPNPFFGEDQFDFLSKILGVKTRKAKWLVEQEDISVQVLTRGNHTEFPRNMDEIRIFTRSILTTLSFAHSRNVANVDLFAANCLFDGEKVYLFDWNDGVVVEGTNTPLRFYEMVPPEGEGKGKNETFHINPWAYDMWTVGRMMARMMRKCCDDVSKEPRSRQAEVLFSLMANDDPYKRPDADTLLKHPFLLQQ